jgi:hypothetical protein
LRTVRRDEERRKMHLPVPNFVKEENWSYDAVLFGHGAIWIDDPLWCKTIFSGRGNPGRREAGGLVVVTDGVLLADAFSRRKKRPVSANGSRRAWRRLQQHPSECIGDKPHGADAGAPEHHEPPEFLQHQ